MTEKQRYGEWAPSSDAAEVKTQEQKEMEAGAVQAEGGSLQDLIEKMEKGGKVDSEGRVNAKFEGTEEEIGADVDAAFDKLEK